MSSSGFRPLLPATRPRSPTSSGPVAKKKRTAVACNPCRTRRIGCDGEKPSCEACKRGHRECVYMNEDDVKTLREKIAAYQEIMEHLRSRLPHVTQGVLQRLAAGADPVTVLKSLKGEMPEATVSEKDTARGVLPIILSDGEFELLVRHPNAYPTIDLAAYAGSSHSTVPNKQYHHVASTPRHVPQPEIDDFVGPLEPTQYYDERLAHLDIKFWTHVPITNTQAAGAISLFLETQLPVWGFFDSNLFVRDLVECGLEFCSPFMVTALLAFALQSYTLLEPEAQALSHVFEEEAIKLALTDASDTLPNMAACVLTYSSIAAHGEVPKAAEYLTIASKIAERMRLFEEPNSTENPVSLETLIFASKAAWGLFNFFVLMSPFHVTPPVKRPPIMQIPINRDSPQAHKGKTEKPDRRPSDLELNEILVAFCELRTTANEVMLIYRDEKSKSGSLAFALSKYHQLLKLADRLPPPAIRQKSVSNSSLIFHMSLHMTILDIFRPFIVEEKQHGFTSYQRQSASPITIFAASVQQIKGLIHEYAVRYRPHEWHMSVSCAIIYAYNAVVKNELDPNQRPQLIFYISMLQRGNASYWVFTDMIQALLVTAIDKGVLTRQEALAIVKNPNRAKGAVRNDEPGWVVDMGTAVYDVTAAGVNTLASRFEEMVVFSDFTEGLA